MSTEPQVSSQERSSDLWFEDGNLIVRAGGRLFKVYRGILAAQSPVFSDMFSLPPTHDQEILDGCPLVELLDDPDSVEFFLRAVLEPGFFPPPPALSQYHIVAGILRIANKYECATLRTRSLQHLSARFPCTIEDHIHREQISKPLFSEYDSKGLAAYVLDSVSLLAEVDATWCLPFRYLTICEDSARNIIKGVDYRSQHYEVHPDQKHAIIMGRERIIDDEIPKHMKTLAAAAPECRGGTCRDARIRMLTNFITLPLWVLCKPWQNDWCNFETLEFCEQCHVKVRQNYDEIKIKLWKCLPEVFDLPSWEELKKMKQEALGYVKEYKPSVRGESI
ncbi:hypothetical protein DL96DRAFT_1608158 [Flagelloscypha sp. PMI_526]|nr:hypothetical protein DL96DRAFT_1608158 [Flagelloscypha sp. PMI_526]